MAWSDGLIAAFATRFATVQSATYSSVAGTTINTDTQTNIGGNTSAGTTNLTTSNSVLQTGSGITKSNATATDGTTAEAGLTGFAFTSGFTGSGATTQTGSGVWIITTTDSLGSTHTDTQTSSFSSTTGSSFDNTPTVFPTLFHVTGTIAQTTTYNKIISRITTATTTAPTLIGGSTTTTHTTFSETDTTTQSGTSSFQAAAGNTLTLTDGLDRDIFNFTYYVPPNSVAWVITDTGTDSDLVAIHDRATSYTDSFTVQPSTTTRVASGGVFTPATPPITYSGLTASNITLNVIRTYLTTQSTTATLSTIDEVPNSTRTTTSIASKTATFLDTVTNNPGLIPDAGNTFSAFLTDHSTIEFPLLTTVTDFSASSDSSGHPAGFTTVTNQSSYYTTGLSTIPAAAGTFISSHTDTAGGVTNVNVGNGVTGVVTVPIAGFILPDTQGIAVLDPALPNGVCVPTGKISNRLAQNVVSIVGGGSFPSPYCLGVQTGVSSPLIAQVVTTIDTAGNSWTIKYSGASVTVSKRFPAGSVTSATTFSGIITGIGNKTERFYSFASDTRWVAYGGATPNGTSQKVMIPKAIWDATTIDGSTHNGTIQTKAATTISAQQNSGDAINYMPAYNVGYGPDPALAIILQAYT